MNWLKSVGESIYGPEYYKQVVAGSLGQAFKYYLKLALVLSLVGAIFSAVWLGPKLGASVGQAVEKLVTDYPANLEVKIQNGQVSTNVVEPYFVALPADSTPTPIAGSKNPDLVKVKNILVIDTKTPFSLEQFKNYETAAWLTADSVAYYKDSSIVIQNLSKVNNFTVDQAFVSKASGWVSPIVKATAPILAIGVFLLMLFIFALQLLYLLIASLLVWLVAKLKGVKIGYGQSYQVGLHATTLPLLAEGVFILVGLSVPLPFFWTIVLLLVVALNLKVWQPVA